MKDVQHRSHAWPHLRRVGSAFAFSCTQHGSVRFDDRATSQKHLHPPSAVQLFRQIIALALRDFLPATRNEATHISICIAYTEHNSGGQRPQIHLNLCTTAQFMRILCRIYAFFIKTPQPLRISGSKGGSRSSMSRGVCHSSMLQSHPSAPGMTITA